MRVSFIAWSRDSEALPSPSQAGQLGNFQTQGSVCHHCSLPWLMLEDHLLACLQAARMLRMNQPQMMAGSLTMCTEPPGPSSRAIEVLVKLRHLSGGLLEPGAVAMHLCLMC